MPELLALGALGFVVGAFGTLVGAGGGFLLVPILLIVYPHRDADTITAMSLFVVLGNASSGSLAYAFQRRIDYRSGLTFALATIPGVVAGAWVVQFISRRTFDLIFAALLASVGIYLNLRRDTQEVREPLRGRGVISRTVTDREGNTYRYAYHLWQGVAISSVAGFVASLLGIGGGTVHVPMMAVVLRFPVHIATATSHFVLAMVALEATIARFASGSLGWNHTLAQAGAMCAGAIIGAQVGARLSHHVHGHVIIRALGFALILVAARLLWTAL